MLEKQILPAGRGLALPRSVLRRLDRVGVFAQSHVSLEHQHLARRYVVRGIESGGAVKEIGRYVTFSGPDGRPLPYLHPIDSIGLNGLHGVVIAPILVRIELFRTGRTCQLLIMRHEPGEVENNARPPLISKALFRGVNGFLSVENLGGQAHRAVSAVPQFWTRAGEEREIPAVFVAAVQAATAGASCVGCSHDHFLVAPAARPELVSTSSGDG